MATLKDILGKPLTYDELQDIEKHFNSEDATSRPNLDPMKSSLDFFKPSTEQLEEDYESPHGLSAGAAALDVVSATAWSTLDSALFGAPSWAVEAASPELAEWLAPQTKAGKVGAGIGGTIGFIKGAPMKAGAKVASGIGQAIARKAGYEVLDDVVKKSTKAVLKNKHIKQFNTKVKQDILRKEVPNRLKSLGHQARWDKAAGTAAKENWQVTSNQAIRDLLSNAIKAKDITSKEAALILNTYSKNITTKPMQDVVDLVMKRHPNKFGYIAGDILHGGVLFGLIDAVMEVPHSQTRKLQAQRELGYIPDDVGYDPLVPLWGVAVGAGFSFLNLLPAAGKQSITSADFKAGFNAIWRKNPYKEMSAAKLRGNAKVMGETLKVNDHSTKIAVTHKNKRYDIDLLEPHVVGNVTNTKEATEILRKGMQQDRLRWGRTMMKESIKEDFKSTLANWKRVLGGTAIMNARTIMEMRAGYDMPAEDIMTSLMIGAFINRRNPRALTPESSEKMMKKMNRIRWNLNMHGETQYAPLALHPTLAEHNNTMQNPLTHSSFKDINTMIDNLQIRDDLPETVSQINPSYKNSPTLSASNKFFPYFDEIYNYIRGTSGSKSIKPKALITEAEASQIESKLKSMDFDGVTVKSVKDLREVLNNSVEYINDDFRYSIKRTTSDVVNYIKGENIKRGDKGDLGMIPETITINEALMQDIRNNSVRGEDGSIVDIETAMDAQRHVNRLLKFNHVVGTGTTNGKNVEINTPEELRNIMARLRNGKSSVNSIFKTTKKDLKFEWDSLEQFEQISAIREVNKSVDAMDKEFDDVKNPEFNNLRNLLSKIGIVRSGTELGKHEILPYEALDITRAEGEGVGQYDALLKTVIGILGSKGNRSLPVAKILLDPDTKQIPKSEKVPINISDVAQLDDYLKSRGMNTQMELLNDYRTYTTRRIFENVTKDSKVDMATLNTMGELSEVDIGLVQYVPMAEGGTGFGISKINFIGKKNAWTQRYIDRYNDFVDKVIEDGTTPDGKNWISLTHGDDPNIKDGWVSFRDRQDLKIISDVIRRNKANVQQDAMEKLIDFARAMDPEDSMTMSFQHYLGNTDNPNAMIRFLVGQGVLMTKKKRGAFEYVFSEKAFKKNIPEIKKLMGVFGKSVDEIEAMKNEADQEFAAYQEGKYHKESGGITQQSFFKKWMPDATGTTSKYAEAKDQNEFLNDAMYDASTGKLRTNPYVNVIKGMDFKYNNEEITGDFLLKNRNKKGYKGLYGDALNDVVKMLAYKYNSTDITVVDAVGKGFEQNNKVIQKSNLTEFLNDEGFPLIFTTGDIFTRTPGKDGIINNKTNIFEMFSSLRNETQVEDMKFQKQLMKRYEESLGLLEYTNDQKINTSQPKTYKGFAPILIGNAKDALLVPKDLYKQVAELFKKNIYDVYLPQAIADNNRVAIDRIENTYNNLKSSKIWTKNHEDAMRSLIVEQMTKGKNVSRFLKTIEGEGLTDIGKRYSLYHTPSFKKLSRSLLNRLDNAIVRAEDKKIIKMFQKRSPMMAVWNDEDMAKIFNNRGVVKAFGESFGIDPNLPAKKYKEAVRKEIRNMVGKNRKNETGFDSITFISKEFKKLLNLYYGTDNRDGGEGSAVFKPIISSNGNETYFFGKTVFIYDPSTQRDIFDKNKGLDILTTRSADKMKSSISSAQSFQKGNPTGRFVYIDKTVDQMVNSKKGEILKFAQELPLSSIGISTVPENRMSGSQSISYANFMNSAEHEGYYNTYFKDNIKKVLGNPDNSIDHGISQKSVKNSIWRRQALLKLKNLPPNITINDLQNSPGGFKALGDQIEWALMGGDPNVLSNTSVINMAKTEFIDPLFSPPLQTSDGERTGGKFVIKQSFGFRDLKPTIRKGEKENTEIDPGDVLLPKYAGSIQIDYAKDEIETMILNDKAFKVKGDDGKMIQYKKNQQIPWREALGILLKRAKYKKGDADNYINQIAIANNLERLHVELQSLNSDWNVGIVTNRFPRTAPNDMAVLKLKGFLGEDDGNTGIVNAYDVFNIFEGDYDVDEVDFQVAVNRSMWSHIDRAKQHWVNTKDPSFYDPPSQNLQLLTNGDNNSDWNTFDANNRVLKRGIGIVQKGARLVNHVANLGTKVNDPTKLYNGMNLLMEVPVEKNSNDKYRIVVDYDNSNFFERQALEAQLIIDYWKGVSPDIVDNMNTLRNKTYFPEYKNSIGKEDVADLSTRMNDMQAASPNNTKIRLFRKFGPEGEVALNDIDVGIISSLMSEHGKLLNLTGQIYDSSGGSAKPTYQNIMEIGTRYFHHHMHRLTSKPYLSLRNKIGKGITKDEFELYFGHAHNYKERKWVSSVLAKLKNKKDQTEYNKMVHDLAEEKANSEIFNGRYVYRWHDGGPFTKETLNKAKEIENLKGREGSVVERIIRTIVHKDPLNIESGPYSSDFVFEGDLFKQLQDAQSLILDSNFKFGNYPNEMLNDILPKLTSNVNKDIKLIKSYRYLISQLRRDYRMNETTKEKRIKALQEYIDEKQQVLKDYLDPKFIETGDFKYLKSIDRVDITEESEYLRATQDMYTLYSMSDIWNPDKKRSKQFNDTLSDLINSAVEEYGELYNMSTTGKYGNKTILTEEMKTIRGQGIPTIEQAETRIMEKLNKAFDQHSYSILFKYAMPTKAESTIGFFNNTPLVVSTKANGRYRRVLRFLFDRKNAETNKAKKIEIQTVLEQLAERSTAYSDFFNGDHGIIPLKNEEFLSAISGNVPGFNQKLVNTYDRYESIGIEKGLFSRNVFGMGREYDANLNFFRRVIFDNTAMKKQNATDQEIKELGDVISNVNQLAMENNYLDPASHFLSLERIKRQLSEYGIPDNLKYGAGNVRLDANSTIPELQMIGGNTEGITLKPVSMLSRYRMELMQKMIKQGKDIKRNLKRDGETIEESRDQDFTVGPCNPTKY